jgi:hypothetical protein
MSRDGSYGDVWSESAGWPLLVKDGAVKLSVSLAVLMSSISRRIITKEICLISLVLDAASFFIASVLKYFFSGSETIKTSK